jgi:hypothetical protein
MRRVGTRQPFLASALAAMTPNRQGLVGHLVLRKKGMPQRFAFLRYEHEPAYLLAWCGTEDLWLFGDSDPGGSGQQEPTRRSRRRRLNGRDPKDHLRHVHEGIENYPIKRVHELLP